VKYTFTGFILFSIKILNDLIYFDIEDTGIGISEEKL
jgi:signal transduction histidine kinase